MSVFHTELSYCTSYCTVGNPARRQVQYAGARSLNIHKDCPRESKLRRRHDVHRGRSDRRTDMVMKFVVRARAKKKESSEDRGMVHLLIIIIRFAMCILSTQTARLHRKCTATESDSLGPAGVDSETNLAAWSEFLEKRDLILGVSGHKRPVLQNPAIAISVVNRLPLGHSSARKGFLKFPLGRLP